MNQPNGEVKIITAIELSDDDREKLRPHLARILGQETPAFNYEVDRGIIAGIIIQTRNRIIDGSVKTKLVALRQRIAGERPAEKNGQTYDR